ncbi:MAG TPA: energy-coupling factor transporter transmembrane component T [Limnochordales bacterium]|nr:energy-coupling factor transporter transmembrane component T [Limnochordales bacterium]
MLRDVTLGQYVPGRSPLHRTDARAKLLAGLCLAAALFVVNAWAGYGALAAYVLAMALVSGLPLGLVVRSVRPVLWLVALTVVFHGLFTPGTPWAGWGPFQITVEGLDTAGRLAVRLILLVAGVSLVTLTTSPVALADALEWLLKPGQRLGLPAHEIAMMMTIALRFVPTLLEELERIVKAQQARGADLETGGLLRRARALLPVLVPLFVGTFRRAEDLALAMEARGWRGGVGRTRWRAPRWALGDTVALAGSLLFFAWVGWRFR